MSYLLVLLLLSVGIVNFECAGVAEQAGWNYAAIAGSYRLSLFKGNFAPFFAVTNGAEGPSFIVKPEAIFESKGVFGE